MKLKCYEFTWEDGLVTISHGYSKDELAKMIQAHGRVVSTVRII